MPAEITVYESDQCAKVIQFKHKVGCKNGSLSALWDWLNSNSWAMFVILAVPGIVICLFGRKLFRPVLFLAGLFLTVCLVLLIFYSTFLKSTTKQWVGWVVLGCSFILGILVGVLFAKCAKVGAFVLAGWGGFCVSLLIYNCFLYKMNSQIGFWFFVVAVAVAFGILAIFFFDHIIILSTALLGSFMAIYGLGIVAGRYPNPFTVVDMIRYGQETTIDPVFYAYLVGNLILLAAGLFVQYKHKKNSKNDDSGHNPYARLR